MISKDNLGDTVDTAPNSREYKPVSRKQNTDIH